MVLDDVWRILTDHVFTRDSTDRLFNPYKDSDPALDVPEAPEIRVANLRSYLEAYDRMPGIFLLAEAPGPWGCRFSGVPITSESQLLDENFPIHGRRSSTADQPYSEYSASIHWRVLSPYFPSFLTWNAVPFHPHKTDQPLSIRTPTAGEIDTFCEVVHGVVRAVRPDHIAAVGRKAERALDRLGVENTYVRHPSQGGAKRFEQGVMEILENAGIA